MARRCLEIRLNGSHRDPAEQSHKADTTTAHRFNPTVPRDLAHAGVPVLAQSERAGRLRETAIDGRRKAIIDAPQYGRGSRMVAGLRRGSLTLDAYLLWIDQNSQAWRKLMQSATTVPEARDLIEGFRAQTLQHMLARLTGQRAARPALRSAIQGWLGYIDAAILDWADHQDLTRQQLRDMLITAFGATLHAAQHADPKIQLSIQ
jgi:hypothetical protein